MGKKSLIIIFSILILLTLNTSMALEIDDSDNNYKTLNTVDGTNIEVSQDIDNTPVSQSTYTNDTEESKSSLKSTNKVDTHIDIISNTTFDVKGDYFKVKLLDINNKTLKNYQLSFLLNGKTYNAKTNNKGIVSLKLSIKDNTYKITTKFAGDSKYKSSSKTTTITMNNTRIVKSGLNSNEIQEIIDNAKAGNVILFKGKTYTDINLIINKTLTLQSNVNTVLSSSANKPVFSIKGKDSSLSVIKGFIIQSLGNAIEIKNSDYVTVYDNEISSSVNGIICENVNYLNITKNKITQNSKAGIVIGLANHSYIIDNVINNNLNGIDIAKSKYTYIYCNDIKK